MTDNQKVILLCRALKAMHAYHNMLLPVGSAELYKLGYDGTTTPEDFVKRLREEALVAAGDKLPQP